MSKFGGVFFTHLKVCLTHLKVCKKTHRKVCCSLDKKGVFFLAHLFLDIGAWARLEGLEFSGQVHEVVVNVLS